MISRKYIIVTRPLTQHDQLQKQLEELGFQVLSFPSITIHKNILTIEIKKILQNLSSFDWIVFTSGNGAQFFIQALKEEKIDISILQTKKIAAVGSKTAERLKEAGLSVHFIPTAYTTHDLGKELPNIDGKKILLPRTNIATHTLTELLKAKGGIVTNIAIYKTELAEVSSRTFEELLKNQEIQCMFFTSPSTVEGFFKNIQDIKTKEEIYNIPVVSIGPVTADTLKKYGFNNISTADTFTIAGMIRKLKENIL